MKFVKLIALLLMISTLLLSAVACQNGGETQGTTEPSSEEQPTADPNATTGLPFHYSLLITVSYTDAEGKKVEETLADTDKKDVLYYGTKPTDSLTMFDLIADYCFENDIEYELSEDGSLLSIGDYSTEEGGFVWEYLIDDAAVVEYDKVLSDGVAIEVKFTTGGEPAPQE